MQYKKAKLGKAYASAPPECHFALIVQGMVFDNS